MGGMNLRLILGPAGSGKAGRAVACVREVAARAGEVFMVVPGAADRARFLRELAASGDGVLLGVEVGTFDQLVARVAGSPPVRRTDRSMERLVVRDALDGQEAFVGAARWYGFAETARAHVDRLRTADVWGGAELERVLAALPGGEVAAWRALERRVDALLSERRLRDDAWFERRAAQALRRGTPGVQAVVVHGFDALPAHRVQLLEQLARHAEVTVTLPWRPGRRVHERASDLRDRWRARGAFVEELEAEPTAHPLLDWLGAELYEESPAAAPALAAGDRHPVRFVDCCGALQEAEEVVREVARCASEGHAWEEIAVASASGGADAELLLATFERAGIPARLQARRTAVDVPAGRALHDLLDAVCSQDAMRVVAALRSPIFSLDARRLDDCELRLRAQRGASSGAAARRALDAAAPPAVRALLDWRRADGQGAVLPHVRELIASLLPHDIGELDLLRGIAATLEGLALAAGGAERVTLADVRDAVASFPLAVPDRSDTGAVVVASIDDLRSVSFPALVLRGMHLGGFRVQVDDELQAPSAARDLLHLAVTRARAGISVVRQAAGSDGSVLAPSPAWLELRRLLPDAPARTRRLGTVVVEPDDVLLASEVPGSVALAAGRGVRIDEVDDVTRAIVARARRVARPRQVEGTVAAELAALRRISVTAVEAYATCPAKWFIERHLRVRDPDDDCTRMLEGSLAHALLQQLAPDARTGVRTLDETAARALELAPQLAQDIDRGGLLDRPRIERVAGHVVAVLAAEQEWAEPDRVDVERSFGSDTPGAIGPGLVVHDVEVVGRVDRIDSYGSRVLLHDYKYRSSGWNGSQLLAERHLQLPVYWLALEQPGIALEPIGAVYRALTDAGRPTGMMSAEMRDIGIVKRRQRAGVLDEQQRDELLAQTRELVEGAVDGIRSAVVHPLGSASECPQHCRLQTICRVGEGVE